MSNNRSKGLDREYVKDVLEITLRTIVYSELSIVPTYLEHKKEQQIEKDNQVIDIQRQKLYSLFNKKRRYSRWRRIRQRKLIELTIKF